MNDRRMKKEAKRHLMHLGLRGKCAGGRRLFRCRLVKKFEKAVVIYLYVYMEGPKPC